MVIQPVHYPATSRDGVVECHLVILPQVVDEDRKVDTLMRSQFKPLQGMAPEGSAAGPVISGSRRDMSVRSRESEFILNLVSFVTPIGDGPGSSIGELQDHKGTDLVGCESYHFETGWRWTGWQRNRSSQAERSGK